MVFTLPSKTAMVFSVVACCAALIGCSSSDDGKSAELERQLDVEKAALMTAQEEVAALRAQVQALMGRPDITPQALQDLRDQVAELSGRAQLEAL